MNRTDWCTDSNPPSTFCYLSAQRDALGQLVNGQLAVEVALLGRGANLHDDCDGDHDGDEEEAHAVDDDLQVGVVGRRIVWDGWMVEGGGDAGGGGSSVKTSFSSNHMHSK